MRRLLLLCGVAGAASACVSEFPAIDPASPSTRGPRVDLSAPDPADGRVADRGTFDRGATDRGAEPEPEPDADPAPDAQPDRGRDAHVVDAGPRPDMAPPRAPFIPFDAIASGLNFACARRAADGRVQCWGQNVHGQLNAPAQPLETFGLGYEHGCGYDPDAFITRCWGRNDRAQATRVTGTLAVFGFAGGDRITCGLTEIAFACLGQGELFRFEATRHSSVGVGRSHICAMPTADAPMICWGDGSEGRHAPPRDIPLRRDSLASSANQTCAIVLGANTLACWGPGADPPVGFYRDVFPSAGDHLCAINIDDEAICWGEDNRGQASPPPGVAFKALAGGAEHTCGLEANGRVRCWGSDDHGQLQVPTP